MKKDLIRMRRVIRDKHGKLKEKTPWHEYILAHVSKVKNWNYDRECKGPFAVVRVNSETHSHLEKISHKTGVPISKIVEIALEGESEK